MGLKIQIDGKAFDSLDENLQALYVQDGDGYKLDAEFENTDGLKNKNTELLSEIKKLKSKQLPDGFDLDKAIKALEAQDSSERDLALKRGEFEKIRVQIEKAATEELELQNKLNAVLDNNAEKDLTMELVGHGVFENKASRMAKLLRLENIKSVQNEGGEMIWRSLDDTQTIDLKKYIPSLKEDWGEFFKPTNASGGGAVGSSKITTGKSMARTSFDGLSQSDKATFLKDGGTLTD